MSADYFRLKRRCGVENCRSREYVVDADGLTYCRRGHVQESRGIAHSQDFEDVNVAASQTTRVRDSQKEERERAAVRALGGPVGLKLYRLAYEHLLRRQLQILTQQKGFPPEVEQLGMELWALRAAIARENGTDLDSQRRATENEEASDPGGYDHATRKEESEVSDSRFGESDISDGASSVGSRFHRRGKVPGLLEMYAICYLAVIITRNPLTVRRLHEWVVSDELLYLRAINAVPWDIRRRFEPWFYAALGVNTPLGQGTLQWQISSLVALLINRFESLRLPNLNWHPILLDYCLHLALPLHVYSFLEGLFRVLGIELSFPAGGGGGEDDGQGVQDGPEIAAAKRLQAKAPGRKHTVTTVLHQLPGIQLMAWLVFAVKFLYPFDKRERFATAQTEPDILAIDWNEWLVAHEWHDDAVAKSRLDEDGSDTTTVLPRPFGPGAEMKVEPHEVRSFDGAQMDAYMDWFTATWIDDGTDGTVRGDGDAGDGSGTNSNKPSNTKSIVTVPEGLLRMFPLTGSGKKDRTGGRGDAAADSSSQPRNELQRRDLEIAAQKRLIRDVHAHLRPRTTIVTAQREMEQQRMEQQREKEEERRSRDNNDREKASSSSAKTRDRRKKKEKKEKELLRVGQRYTRYRTTGDLDTHGPAARPFHERAALAAQVELSTLLKVVLSVEAVVLKSKEKIAAYEVAATEELASLKAMIEENERRDGVEGMGSTGANEEGRGFDEDHENETVSLDTVESTVATDENADETESTADEEVQGDVDMLGSINSMSVDGE